MKYEHWQIPAAPEDAIKTLMDAGYPYLVSSVLAARGVTTSEQAAEALEREKTLAYSPFLMKDMDKAVARISKALENGEKLAVFGDYDVDGITSTCLLTDYLRSRGADVTMHIPRRIEEGYGLGCDAIRALSESGVTLIVTVDCGITGERKKKRRQARCDLFHWYFPPFGWSFCRIVAQSRVDSQISSLPLRWSLLK